MVANSQDWFPYLDHPADKALLSATPTLMVPVAGRLQPPGVGDVRFVVSSRGLHLEARSEAVEMRFLAAESAFPLPYGEVADGIRLAHGGIPLSLFDAALRISAESSPDEWAGLVVWNNSLSRYELIEPEILSRSGAHISYQNSLPSGYELVLDLHSHGLGEAFFSGEDDVSDQGGIYLAGVIGHCDRPLSSMCFRAVAHGRFARIYAKLDGGGKLFFTGIFGL